MKKFLCFLGAILILIAMVGYMGYKYILPKDYPVFIESFDHGVMTVRNDNAIGNDKKFEIFCKYGEKVTVNINPERGEGKNYNLSKLTVNGVDVTDQVQMLEYTFTVAGKTTVLAYFSKSKAASAAADENGEGTLKPPEIFDYAENEYFGSANAYDISDPSIIYDETSSLYYCFASDNVVMSSEDLLNWEKRGNYFPLPEAADSTSLMSFSAFPSVKKWAEEHGYSGDENVQSITNDRRPIAPEIIKYGGTYYLYFSLSKEANANESAIFCVKTNDLKTAVETMQWEDVGLVVSSCGRNSTSSDSYEYDDVNATHPSVFTNGDGTKLFMAYGSYFGREVIKGSISLLELDPSTGLLKKGSSINSSGSVISTQHGKTMNSGVMIANPGRIPSLTKDDGSLVSACDVFFNQETGYYYLLMTYGVSDTNYEIRAARSKDPDGPYLDINGNDVASFGRSSSNMYKKGTPVAAGYNFSMSSVGGVSYTDIGRASIGAPNIVHLSDGKWLMASQSRGYYKIDGNIYCGDAYAGEEEEYTGPTAPALEIRQLYFAYDWPMAMPETFDNETVGEDFTKAQLYGNWDVIIFDGTAPDPEYNSVTRYTSKKVSLFRTAAITEKMIDRGDKLDGASFKKSDAKKYMIILDGVTYQVFPTIVWDNELDEEVIAITGFGDDGSLIWGKNAFSSYMGIYLETFNYLTSIANSDLEKKYSAKLEKISDNPTQEKINAYCSALVKEILASESSDK